jgi:hypothetical protein
MEYTKISSTTLGISKVEEVEMTRLKELVELRTKELAMAQANLDEVNKQLQEAIKLGIK